ncbi:MAG: PAS domain-containing sensor histidine kinase [Parvibaculaceae bacterium]
MAVTDTEREENTLDDAQRDEIGLELLGSVMRSFVYVPLLYPAVCALFAIYLPSTLSPFVVLGWWLAIVATQIEYVFYRRRFARQAHKDADHWTKTSAIRFALMNSVWVMMVPLFWSANDHQQNLSIVVVQIIHCLIATILTGPRRLTLIACSAPTLVVSVIAAFVDGTPLFLVLTMGFLITYTILVRTGELTRRSRENEFILNLRNQTLIDELGRRQEQFRALVDNAFDGIIVTDADQIITYASPSIRQIGLDPQALPGHSVYAFLQPDEVKSIQTSMELHGTATPLGVPVEFHTTRADGKVHWFEASVSDLRDNPNINGYVLNIRDMTERKRSRMELENQSRVLEALSTGAPIDDVLMLVAQGAEEANPTANVAIYLVDENLDLKVCASPSFPATFRAAIDVFWNNNKDKAFGQAVLSEEGLLVIPDLHDLADQDDVIEFATTFGVRALWMQQFKASEFRGGSGSIAVYLKEPRKPSKWERAYLTGIAQLASIAITRRRAEQNLREATRNAELANRAKSKFLANMSHELRTPLNAIIGFSDIMKSELFGALGNARYAEYAQDINDSGAHLLSVIDDILDISKIEAGRYTLEESYMDLGEHLRWSIEMVRPRTSDKKITVTLDIDDDLPPLYADTRAIRQIMLNLLSNAAKFTPENGAIMVEATRDGAGTLRLSVRDNGIGIPVDKLQTVLEPFGQVDDTTARQHGGTGLGLSITKALVELHDGAFRLDSVLGRGTAAEIFLPSTRMGERAANKKTAND